MFKSCVFSGDEGGIFFFVWAVVRFHTKNRILVLWSVPTLGNVCLLDFLDPFWAHSFAKAFFFFVSTLKKGNEKKREKKSTLSL